MQNDCSYQVIRIKLFIWLVAAAIPVSLVAQGRTPGDYRGSYYYQAYDQGFRAGQSDYNAGRPYGYHSALLMTAGVVAISQDYRNAFKLGYQDGYAGHGRGADWYYRNHRHDCDCDEDDRGVRGDWNCRARHDNGKHKGWYKHRHNKHDEDDDD
jgi:hypothetical protein